MPERRLSANPNPIYIEVSEDEGMASQPRRQRRRRRRRNQQQRGGRRGAAAAALPDLNQELLPVNDQVDEEEQWGPIPDLNLPLVDLHEDEQIHHFQPLFDLNEEPVPDEPPQPPPQPQPQPQQDREGSESKTDPQGFDEFHELSEFDEAKRSCRRRLAGHNERRRKIPAAADHHSHHAVEGSRKCH